MARHGSEDVRRTGRPWRRKRAWILQRDPLCRICERRASSEVDHIIPLGLGGGHESENLQGLCRTCHREKSAAEYALDTRNAVNPDGTPVGWGHGWQPGQTKITLEDAFPRDLRPSAIPLTIICGPPASGKSTYVAGHKDAGDIVIDMDDIVEEIGGRSRAISKDIRKRAILERNRRLRALHTYDGPAARAWFTTMAQSPEWRTALHRMLEPAALYVMLTPKQTCIKRVMADRRRASVASIQLMAIKRFFDEYAPSPVDAPIHGEWGV